MAKKQSGQPLTAEQKRQMRRRRARRRAVFRGVALLLVCVIVVLLWQNWDVVAPDRLYSHIQDLMGSSTGSYPVDFSGVGVQRLERVENYSVVLTDSHLIYLNQSGAEVNRYGCAYPSALMCTTDRYVLIAEQGGRRLQLSNRTSIVTEMEVDNEIIAVALNDKGQMAVLMQGSQGYLVQIKVYDRKGKLLYTRSRNQTATEIALSPDGRQVALLSIKAADGTLTSSMDVFSLITSDTEALCSHKEENTLLYRMEYLSDGWLVAFSDAGAVMMDTADGLASVYMPAGMRVLGYAVGTDNMALVLRPYGSTGDGEVHIVNKEGIPTATVPFEGVFRDLSEQGGRYVLLTDTYAQRLTATGEEKRVTVEADGRQAVLDGENAVVLGLNRLLAYPLT